jgi:hypothetical protein
MLSTATRPRSRTTPKTDPAALHIREEGLACAKDTGYFLDHYVQIYDAGAKRWVPFRLWDAQLTTLDTVQTARLLVILKARQLGLTWLILGYFLWLMLFRPEQSILLFSRRQEEAWHLLERLKGMHDHLPPWLQARQVVISNSSVWQLGNGSVARAFPTTAGDSYTATAVLADEFDLVEDQEHLLTAVEPTINDGGQLILLSRSDKSRPQTPFKKTYRAAQEGDPEWTPIFLPWSARPGRTRTWYQAQVQRSLTRTGGLDVVWEQYPETWHQALAPPQLNKRIPAAWLEGCYGEQPGLALATLPAAPNIPGLVLYSVPAFGHEYVGGLDPAEGKATSDDSALTFLDRLTGEEVASLSGKFEPAVFASYAAQLARYFNGAALLVERNNHGHAVILWLRDNAGDVRLLDGLDGAVGWNETSLGKTLLYDAVTEAFRLRDTRLHTEKTYTQLASIERATLRAPKEEPDDCADSYALAVLGHTRPVATFGQSSYLQRSAPR